jgi:hypothetical protein
MKIPVGLLLSLLVTARAVAQPLPMAGAGAPGAPLQPEPGAPWAVSLASGVAGRWGGERIQPDKPNATVLLSFGAQADGLWGGGIAQAARLRLRLFTGGDGILFVPSDGEFEAAYLLGRREFRFALGRIELARHPGLALEALVQASTLPSVEGLVDLDGDRVRLFYGVMPVEAAYVWYAGGAHLTGSPTARAENATVEAASAVRLRATFQVPPRVQLSAHGDFMRMWGPGDQRAALEGSAGLALLDRTLLLELLVRWDHYTRRGRGAPGAMEAASQLMAVVGATLVL